MHAVTLLKVQVAVVAMGTLFMGIAVATDFYQYLLIGGDLAQFERTPLSNPFLTAHFYEAIGFAVALRWGMRQLSRRDAQRQVSLILLLFAGMLLGLGNVSYQCYLAGPSPCVSWSLLDTPALAGSLLYLAGFGVAIAARRSLLRRPPPGISGDLRLPAHHGVS